MMNVAVAATPVNFQAPSGVEEADDVGGPGEAGVATGELLLLLELLLGLADAGGSAVE